MDKIHNFGKNFLQFVDASPSPFHVCHSASSFLEESGFVLLHEGLSWSGLLNPGGKYYFKRNGSSLVAFCVGGNYQSGTPFKIIGAHTDSPVLRLKPNTKRSACGFEQLAVECYGGGLWHTWFDRDLGLAGRVLLSSPKISGSDNKYVEKLVHINTPVLRVPNLAIHLQTGKERDAFSFNKEEQLTPILCLSSDASKVNSSNSRYGDELLNLVSSKLNCSIEDIEELELSLCDIQSSTFGGANNEFIFAPRLDNQLHCFTSLNAIVSYCCNSSSEKFIADNCVSVICLFDHEEVGSDSNEGAGSPLLRDTLTRIALTLFTPPNSGANNSELLFQESIRISLAKSLLVSADAAHSVHPNYASKHETGHRPVINKGTVIKTNQNQRYMTNGTTGFLIRALCGKNKENKIIPFQEFSVRNDSGCGSTIGPILAKKAGIRTVDIGIPILSMHSIREMAGVEDIWTNKELLTRFFEDAVDVDRSLEKL